MSDSSPTFAQLFFGPNAEPPRSMLEAIHSAKRTENAKGKLLVLAQDLSWSDAWTDICKYLPELFDITLKDTFLYSLKKLREIRKYADPEKYPPDKVVTVHLGDRTLTSKHRPRIELIVGEIVADQLEFQIELKVVIEALGLRIRDGVITMIDTGHCTASCNVSLDGTHVFEKDLGEIDLPGRLSLGKGIPLNQQIGLRTEADQQQ